MILLCMQEFELSMRWGESVQGIEHHQQHLIVYPKQEIRRLPVLQYMNNSVFSPNNSVICEGVFAASDMLDIVFTPFQMLEGFVVLQFVYIMKMIAFIYTI